MEKWPIGVFTSVDAGLGVKLEVAHELGVPTIQLHAPAKETRTEENAKQFLARLNDLGIELTAVFGGFEGESYADIPTVVRSVGLVPPETRAARTQEMKEIADFARQLNCDVVALHVGFIPHDAGADPLRLVRLAERGELLHEHLGGDHLAAQVELREDGVQHVGTREGGALRQRARAMRYAAVGSPPSRRSAT